MEKVEIKILVKLKVNPDLDEQDIIDQLCNHLLSGYTNKHIILKDIELVEEKEGE